MNELRKIIKSNKQLIAIMLLIVCACFSILLTNDFDQKSYSQFYHQIENYSQKQVKTSLNELNQKNDKYQLMLEEGLINTVELNKLSNLTKLLNEEYKVAYNYNTWLNEQISKRETINQISIFQKNTGFQEAVAQKNYKAFKSLEVDIAPKMQPSYGVDIWLRNVVIDFIAIVFSLYCIMFLYIQEEKSGFLNFMRIQVMGRKKLFFSKIFSMFILNFIFLFILYTLTGIIIGMQYGFPNFLEPCQSLLLFKECPLSLNILQLVLLIFIFKWIVLNFFTVILLFFAICFKNVVLMIGTFVGFQIIVSFLSNLFYESTSLFYCIQFLELLHPERYLSRVSCINLFNHAVDYYWLIISIVIITIILVIVERQIFYKHYTEFKRTYTRKISSCYHDIGFFEFYKLHKFCFGLFFVIISILVIGGYSSTVKNVTYFQDIVYNHYIDYISETVDENTFLKIQEEKIRFQQLNELLNIETNKAKAIDISSQLQFEEGLIRYEERAKMIDNNNQELNIIKEDHVRFVFDNDFIKSCITFFVIVSITLSCYLLNEKEVKSKVIDLQKCSGRYHEIQALQKKNIFILSIIINFLLQLLVIFKNITMYGTQWLLYDAAEYSLLFSIPFNIPLSVYLVIQFVYQGIVIYVSVQLLYMGYKKVCNSRLLLLLSLLGILIFTFSMNSMFQNFNYLKYLFFPNQNIFINVLVGSICLVGIYGYRKKHEKGSVKV